MPPKLSQTAQRRHKLQNDLRSDRTMDESVFRTPLFQQGADSGHHLERIGDIDHIGLSARPAAVCVQADGASFSDESPPHRMWLLAMAACGESLRMSRSRACLDRKSVVYGKS